MKTLPNIARLDEDLINKIAAGEVIERPASVVKELVENAIDAGATQVTVSLRDGGKKLIQVVDDGCGIPPNQLPLAVERHATSKITSYDDLFRLRTNGFRGEALASIAAVAQLSLASKTETDEPTEIVIDSGQFVDQRSCAQPQGTTVSVKYLFHKTPARLKFLKSNETETSHVVDVITKLALSHAQVSFRLFNNDRQIFEARTQDDEVARVTHILGDELDGYLYPYEAEIPGMRMHGLVGHPQVSRSQRSSAYFFVNGRCVNDKVIWHAVMEAHRDLLMKGKYPVMTLHLEVDESTIDVNVHPTKSEIRFHQSQAVHGFVYQTLRSFLTQSPWLAHQALTPATNIEQQIQTSQSAPNESQVPVATQTLKSWGDRYFSGQPEVSNPNMTLSFASKPVSPQQEFLQHAAAPQQKKILFGKTPYAALEIIGQFLGTYILCQAEDRLVLIDQHAAHERVGFEKLKLEYDRTGIKSQPLLIPETFDLKPSDAEILREYLDSIQKFGFEIEYFGGNTFVLKALPILMNGKGDIRLLVASWIDDIKATGSLVSLTDRWHHILATTACHAQIRANHHLTREEIRVLLNDLENYQFTDFCPHGRPVSVEVTREEIEKWFKRVL